MNFLVQRDTTWQGRSYRRGDVHTLERLPNRHFKPQDETSKEYMQWLALENEYNIKAGLPVCGIVIPMAAKDAPQEAPVDKPTPEPTPEPEVKPETALPKSRAAPIKPKVK